LRSFNHAQAVGIDLDIQHFPRGVEVGDSFPSKVSWNSTTNTTQPIWLLPRERQTSLNVIDMASNHATHGKQHVIPSHLEQGMRFQQQRSQPMSQALPKLPPYRLSKAVTIRESHSASNLPATMTLDNPIESVRPVSTNGLVAESESLPTNTVASSKPRFEMREQQFRATALPTTNSQPNAISIQRVNKLPSSQLMSSVGKLPQQSDHPDDNYMTSTTTAVTSSNHMPINEQSQIHHTLTFSSSPKPAITPQRRKQPHTNNSNKSSQEVTYLPAQSQYSDVAQKTIDNDNDELFIKHNVQQQKKHRQKCVKQRVKRVAAQLSFDNDVPDLKDHTTNINESEDTFVESASNQTVDESHIMYQIFTNQKDKDDRNQHIQARRSLQRELKQQEEERKLQQLTNRDLSNNIHSVSHLQHKAAAISGVPSAYRQPLDNTTPQPHHQQHEQQQTAVIPTEILLANNKFLSKNIEKVQLQLLQESEVISSLMQNVINQYEALKSLTTSVLFHRKDVGSKVDDINNNYLQLFQDMLQEVMKVQRVKFKVLNAVLIR
jgi:hypothetical protein